MTRSSAGPGRGGPERGQSPSEMGATTGASKQRRGTARNDRFSHEERLESKHGGKQQDWPPDPRPGSGRRPAAR